MHKLCYETSEVRELGLFVMVSGVFLLAFCILYSLWEMLLKLQSLGLEIIVIFMEISV